MGQTDFQLFLFTLLFTFLLVQPRRGARDGVDEILTGIRAGHVQRQLTPRDDDWLAETRQHEGDGGGGVRQRVGAAA